MLYKGVCRSYRKIYLSMSFVTLFLLAPSRHGPSRSLISGQDTHIHYTSVHIHLPPDEASPSQSSSRSVDVRFLIMSPQRL